MVVGAALFTPRPAGSTTQIRQDGESHTYYSDATFTEIVGFERWGCSGSHMAQGIWTEHSIDTVWLCEFGNSWCPSCEGSSCSMDGYSIDCNYLCVLGSNYMTSCGSGAYIGCQIDNTCP